jgi:hypothetical protein
MESVIETKASTILQFIDGLRGDLRVTFEEGTCHFRSTRKVPKISTKPMSLSKKRLRS